jgi:hypothetical protein
VEPPLRLLEPAWDSELLQKFDQSRFASFASEEKPVSQVRLIDRDYLVADWRDGRLQYRLKGVNPWGASVGGQLSTSTAKVTLSWSLNN